MADVPTLAYPKLPLLARVSTWWFRLLVVVFAVYAAHIVFDLGGQASDAAFNNLAYNAVMLGSAIALIMSAVLRPRDRIAVLLISLGLLMWALGDLCYTLFFAHLKNPPYPSIDDALYLVFFPLCYVGLGRLIRARFRELVGRP